MSFIVFAWIASIVYGLMVIVMKLTGKYSIQDPWLFNFLFSLSFLIFTIPPALIGHASVPTHWNTITLTALCYVLSNLFYILALYKVDITTLSPLFNARTAFAVILGAFFLSESLALWQVFLIVIIFTAGIFVAMDEKLSIKSFFRWPIFLAILSMFFLSLAGVFTKKAIQEESYWTVTLFVPLLSQIMLLVTIPFFIKHIRTISLKPILFLAVIGIFNALGTLAANKAYAQNVGISVVIISLPMSMLMALLLAKFSPQLLERHTLKVYLVRILAAGIMIAGAIRLSL